MGYSSVSSDMIIESNIPVIPDAKIVFSNNNYIIISNENNELKVDDLIFVKQNSNIKNINCIKHDEKSFDICAQINQLLHANLQAKD